MRKNEKTLTAIRVALLLLGVAVAAASCATKGEGGTDSSTHWLDECVRDADCGGGLSCECGVCTKACTAPSDCSRLSSTASCAAVPGCSSTSSVCLGARGDAGPPVAFGPCPSDADAGVPCDGRLSSCWLPCAPGAFSSIRALFCDGGSWTVHPGIVAVLCRGANCALGQESGKPCNGSVQGCWTQCTGGFRQELECTDGAWSRGLGLSPCGPDGGAPAVDSGASVEAGTPSDSGSPFPGVSTSCTSSADCYAADRICCPLCGNDPTVADKRGISRSSLGAYNSALCATAGACPPCVPPSGTVESFCRGGRCDAEDIGKYKACKVDADCKLEAKDCCACGALPVTAFVAISDVPGYQGDYCGTVDCATCPSAPHVADASSATCNTSRGYCEIAPQR